MKSLTSNNLIVLSGKVACYCKTFHNDPTLSKSSLNKFDISDLSPTLLKSPSKKGLFLFEN
jgi:hypothetical protein